MLGIVLVLGIVLGIVLVLVLVLGIVLVLVLVPVLAKPRDSRGFGCAPFSSRPGWAATHVARQR
ncbi:MAG: hypothetical protein IT370_22070 [Deltaproteobacteria bacterium]|nr:hypothetical protein [Deltaproteobacteria bacterium]